MPRIVFSFVAAVCCAMLFGTPVSAARALRAAAPAYDWPQLLRNAKHTSYVADPKLTTSTAPTLGLNWMSALRSADLGSPVIGYNAGLQKTIAYVGDERGDVTAYDQAAGTTLWSTSVGFGDSMRSSPLLDADGNLWVATAYGSTLYKLNGTTGSVLCSVKEPIRFNASPMLAQPPGGVPTIYIATNDVGTISGPTVAIRVSDCSTLWTFTKYKEYAGAWATAAYGLDVKGKGRIFLGTADPDSTMYSLDATTGALVWDYTPPIPPGDYDIGAGATVSPPGNNGFADGALYFPNKYGVMYALDLTTGALLWKTKFDNPPAGLASTGRSSAALDGTTLVFGMSDGVEALNAKTGALVWHYTDPTKTEVISSPAIVGPVGKEIVAFGDTGGAFHSLNFATGKDLFDYQTGSYITSSPAVVDGNIVIDSTDGFIYDFISKGGRAKGGTTAIVTPANGTNVPNPQGVLVVSGTAADNAGLTELQVSVQAGGPTGPWYDATTGTWIAGAYNNFVPVKTYDGKKSAWTFSFPVPSAGSTYRVFANAVDIQGQVDRVGAQSAFGVRPNRSQPQLKTGDARVAPGTSTLATGTGFGPNETVTFAIQGVTDGSGVTNAQGTVTGVTVTVPARAAFGPSALVATGQTSKKTSTLMIDVANIWSQFGYAYAQTGFAPNDYVLSDTLEATGNGYVSRAWYFPTGAPVNASPAVANGSAYVGNDAGTFSAIDTSSGAPFWTYTTKAGKPIHGSPAFDQTLVLFGADDGAIYSLATATGQLLGTFPLDGKPTNLTVTKGTIYVATDNGTLYDFADATGKRVWSTAIGAALHQAPAIDETTNLAVVGDDAGTLTELNATTGAVVRKISTGATITAAPALAGGDVYVASSDGVLRTYDEATLTLRWKFSAGAPIRALALSAKTVYVGADNGNFFELAQSDGGPMYQLAYGGGGIVGIGATLDVPFVETASGDVGASKDDQQRILYAYQTGGTLSTSPAIVDGAVFVGAGDGGLYAFTPYGAAPENARERRFVAAQRARETAPAKWTAQPQRRAPSIASRAFQPSGPRDFPLHLDRAGDAPATAVTWHGGPQQRTPRTYLITWPGTRPGGPATLAAQAAGPLAASTVDLTPFPKRFDDAAVRREIAREIAANRWHVDIDTQFVVMAGVTASEAGYCSYHSAFHPGGDVGLDAVYAVVATPDDAGGCGALGNTIGRVRNGMQVDPLLNGLHDELGRER